MNKLQKYTIPAGQYFFGDPCYSPVGNNDWDRLLDFNQVFDTPLVNFDGRIVLGFNTVYGDGLYHSNMDHTIPVDAGLIGLVTAFPGEDAPKGMYLVTFAKHTICFEDSGVMFFGDISVDTTESANREWADHDDEAENYY